MTKRHLVIATRESPLALCQANWVKEALLQLHPQLSIELLGITTNADRLLETTLRQIGGKGLFVKELEEALMAGQADIAVHSMKDVPMILPEGLVLPVICEREEVRDVFVSHQYKSLMELPTSASVGTASLRRQTQLLALRADLHMKDLRGNVQTRLKKLDEGEFAAIVLAGAGLKRLGLTSRITAYFSIEHSLPAAGQGALGIECRSDDKQIQALIAPLNHVTTAQAVSAERAVCRRLNGGCQIPIAAYAEVHHDKLTLRGLVSNKNGTKIIRSRLQGNVIHAETIGLRVAEELMQQGADKILREFQ